MLGTDTWSVRKIAVKALYSVTPWYAIRVCVHRTSLKTVFLGLEATVNGRQLILT